MFPLMPPGYLAPSARRLRRKFSAFGHTGTRVGNGADVLVQYHIRWDYLLPLQAVRDRYAESHPDRDYLNSTKGR